MKNEKTSATAPQLPTLDAADLQAVIGGHSSGGSVSRPARRGSGAGRSARH